jgi:O-antigen ligase/Tfp pilus assembly protein PilF
VDTEDNKGAGRLGKLTREQVDAACERGILGLVLAVVVFGPLALGGVRPSEFLVLQFLTVGVLLLWLVRCWFGKTPRLLWTPICWPVAGFVAYAVVRYATADIEFVARQELIRVLLYAALFLAILNNLHRQQSTRIIALTLVGLGALLSLYAIYQWLADSEHVWHFLKPRCYFKRASGSYICPDHLAGFLSMLMPLAISYALTGRFKTIPRVLLGYAALVMLGGIAVTVCHEAWLGLGIGLAVFFALILRQRAYRPAAFIAIAILVACGTVFYFAAFRPRASFLRLQTARYDQTPWVGIWPAAWRMWQDHPWFGVGPDHFDYRYRQYRQASETQQNRPGRVHNDYLNALVDWGLAGTAVAALAWAALGYGVFRGWKYIRRTASDLNPKKSNKSAFVLGASIGLLALLVQAFFDFNLHIPANAILVVTLMALISGHLRFASERFWITQRFTGKLVASLLLGAASLYLAAQGVRSARQQWWLGRAAAAKDDPAGQLGALQKAFAAEPKDFETAYAIGEHLRMQGMQDPASGQELAADAIVWYRRSLTLNPYDPYSPMRIGMCLHWLRYPREADDWFQKALRLDPNSYFMLAHLGWHQWQSGQPEKARESLEKSLQLKPSDNPFAQFCLKRLNDKVEPKTLPGPRTAGDGPPNEKK